MFLDAGAERFERVCLNAGNRGHIVEVATADLVRLTRRRSSIGGRVHERCLASAQRDARHLRASLTPNDVKRAPQPSGIGSPATAASFSSECVAWSVRTVPDFRAHDQRVRARAAALVAHAAQRSPSVTPVAAKNTFSPG